MREQLDVEVCIRADQKPIRRFPADSDEFNRHDLTITIKVFERDTDTVQLDKSA